MGIHQIDKIASYNGYLQGNSQELDLLFKEMLIVTQEMQKKLVPLFCHCMHPGGILMLGSLETIGQFTDLFSTVDGKSRIFSRTETSLRPESLEFPPSFATGIPVSSWGKAIMKASQNIRTLAEQLTSKYETSIPDHLFQPCFSVAVEYPGRRRMLGWVCYPLTNRK